LDPAVSLVNNITIKKLLAMDHDDIGGPLAEELFIKGFTEKTIMGTKWYVTIKTDLVPTNIVYQFAAPDYLGDNLCLEDVTVSTKTENYMFEMFAYKCSGGSVKNLGAFCKATFSGASAGTWA
jgi:hypothetical protein